MNNVEPFGVGDLLVHKDNNIIYIGYIKAVYKRNGRFSYDIFWINNKIGSTQLIYTYHDSIVSWEKLCITKTYRGKNKGREK